MMAERGQDFMTGSLSLLVVLLAGFLGGMAGGFASDHWGRWRIATLSLGLGFLGSLAFLAFSGPLAFGLLLIGTAALSASNPAIVAFAQEIVPGRSSTASALVMGVGWGTGGLMVSLVGLLADADPAKNVANALWVTTWAAFLISIILTLLGNRIFRKL